MDDLQVTGRGAVSTLVFNRPAKRNAISLEMWSTLPALLRELRSNPDLRVLVVRGAGEEAFASGADIREFRRVRSDVATSRIYTRTVHAAEEALASFPRPTIAMIHGFCIGGGLEVALACDLRFASRAAQFGITAARLGIIYGLASTPPPRRCATGSSTRWRPRPSSRASCAPTPRRSPPMRRSRCAR